MALSKFYGSNKCILTHLYPLAILHSLRLTRITACMASGSEDQIPLRYSAREQARELYSVMESGF